ncbi:Chromatin modification-related protein YNG2 [Nymphon striatum]|nr:Chromatin modification-related protein YNG2 [Nymphon striatum]
MKYLNAAHFSFQVLHSQRMSEKPLRPWIISEKSGAVKAAHCNCMAGLGEACTHISALFFSIDATVRIRDSKTVTESKAYWLLPSAMRNVQYKEIRDIDFTSASSAKRKFEQTLDTATNDVTSLPRTARLPTGHNKKDRTPEATEEEINKQCLEMSHNELVKHCENVADSVTCNLEQKTAVEIATREQILSKFWNMFLHASPSAIADSDHKPAGPHFLIRKSVSDMNARHVGDTEWLSVEYPYIGASPDGLFTCDCCGQRTVEVKCPYSLRSDTLDNCDYLAKGDNGRKHLKTNHEYYYQVQTQMGCAGLEFGYFVVWTEKEIHVELIPFNQEVWNEITSSAGRLFHTAVLPELVGKFYTRLPTNSLSVPTTPKPVPQNSLKQPLTSANLISDDNSNKADLYCHCQTGEHGKMVCCDNENCSYQWFHFSCVGITRKHRGKWFCPDCRKMPEFCRK